MKQQRVDRRNKVLTKFGNAEQRQKRKLRRERMNVKRAVVCLEKAKSFRLGIVSISMWGFLALVGARLAVLQLDQSDRWLNLAKKQHSTSIQVLGSRGSILDAEGRPLAVSVKSFSAGVRPKDIEDRPAFVKLIARELRLTPAEVSAKLSEPGNFALLSRELDEETVDRIKHSELANDIAFVPDFKRVYPQGKIAGSLLGRVSRDNVGIAGLELALEDQLKAKPINFAVRRDAKGTLLTEASEEVGDTNSMVSELIGQLPSLFPDPVFASNASRKNELFTLRNEGQNIRSTIDSVVQSVLEEELEQGRRAGIATRSFAVVMDGETGEILALGQTPPFDPNRRNVASSEVFRNVVLQDAFEPGSTFKPFVLASALENHSTTLSEKFDCQNGKLRVGPITIGDAHPQAVLSARDILIRSSNIGFAKIGMKLGAEKLYDTLRLFGFGEQTQRDIGGETKGLLRPGNKWTEIDLANRSFGQGVSVSALQLVGAFSGFVGGGEVVSPHLFKDSEINRHRVISPQVAAQVIDAMRGVVTEEHGTGVNAEIPGVDVYGKTGTAQKAMASGRGYSNDIIASFIGVADGTNIGVPRKLVMFVAIDEPKSTPRWGGTLAAPVFKKTISRTFSYLLGRS